MPRRRSSRRRRRRGGGLGVLARPLSVLLAAVAIVAALTMFFKVEQVEVAGNVRYSAEQVVAASGVEPGDNLVLFNKYRTSERIYTQLPYITAVRINRGFPSTLLVEVTETRAVAAIQGAGAWWALGVSRHTDGDTLKLLEPLEGGEEQAQEEGYLMLIGLTAAEPAAGSMLRLEEGSPVTAARVMELIAAMDERGMLSSMGEADYSDPSQLALRYEDRFRVELYYDADYGFKMDCLSAAADLMEPNEQGIIRMTMEDDNEVRFIPTPAREEEK